MNYTVNKDGQVLSTHDDPVVAFKWARRFLGRSGKVCVVNKADVVLGVVGRGQAAYFALKQGQAANNKLRSAG